VVLDTAGNLYISQFTGYVRKVSAATGIITTVAGGGSGCAQQVDVNGDGCPATSANLYEPMGMVFDTAGDLYIAEYGACMVRKVNAKTGVITAVAGGGCGGEEWGDGGPATDAVINNPTAVSLDAAGNLYIADDMEGRVREVNAATGIISTVVGGGYQGDGNPAASAALADPSGLARDMAGNLYISGGNAWGGDAIREVSAATGLITTLAGNGTYGYSGDGGPATSAELGRPTGMVVDAAGNLYIVEEANNRVRKVMLKGYQPALAISWTAPAPINYGADLKGMLNASALFADSPVAGSFSYTANGAPVNDFTVLLPGNYALVATFTPVDTTTYPSGQTATVPLTVNSLTPVITWTPPEYIVYGTNLSGLLNATASYNGAPLAGSFAYSFISNGTGSPVTASTVPTLGQYVLGAQFTPTDTVHYGSAYKPASLTVQFVPTVTVTCPAGIVYNGIAHSCTASASGWEGETPLGSFTWSPASSETAGGSYTMTATFTSNDYRYTGATGTGILTIAGKPVTATVTAANKTYDGTTGASLSRCTLTGLLTADLHNVTCSATAASFAAATVGAHIVTATGISLSGSAAGNYQLSFSTATATATISKASQSPTVNCVSPIDYDKLPHGCSVTGIGTCASTLVANVPGSSSLILSCTGDANHLAWAGKGAILINKLNPVISSCTTVASPYDMAQAASTSFSCTITPNVTPTFSVTGPAKVISTAGAATSLAFTGVGVVTVKANVPANTNWTAAAAPWTSAAITVLNTKAVKIAPSTFTFAGTTVVGKTSLSTLVVVTNLTGETVRFDLPTAPLTDFVAVPVTAVPGYPNSCQANAAGYCSFRVTFNPQTAGTFKETLTITPSVGTGNTLSVSLSGVGK